MSVFSKFARCSGILVLFCAGTLAQESTLVITGAVIDVKPASLRFSDRGQVEADTWIDVRLRLQYHNRGEEPIIVPTSPMFAYGTRQLLFLELPSADSPVSARADEYRFPQVASSITSLIHKLDSDEPPSDLFVIIPPGGYFETGDVFRSKSGWTKAPRLSSGNSGRTPETLVPEHSYFKVQYSLSLKDRPEGSDVLADARRRWKRVGKLVLTSNGDFLLSTALIINKLPE